MRSGKKVRSNRYVMSKGAEGQITALKKVQLAAYTCQKNDLPTQNQLQTIGFCFSLSLWNQPVVTIITSTTKSVPTTPHITDHWPLFCIPIKSGSPLATLTPSAPSNGTAEADCSPLWTHCNGLQRETRSVWPPLCDWCWPDPSSGLSQRLRWTCSCN